MTVKDKEALIAPTPRHAIITVAQYRSLFASAQHGILLLDPVTRKIIDANPFMVRMLGYTREQFIGKELRDIGLLEDDKVGKAAFLKLHEKGYVVRDDLQNDANAAGGREVEFISYVYNEEDYQKTQCNFLDFTTIKRTEQMLEERDANYRMLIESLPAVVFLAKPFPPYAPIYVSPNIKVLGYPHEEWFSRSDMWISLIHEEDRARVLDTAEKSLIKGLDTELEYRILTKDGQIYWLKDKGRFISDSHGKKIGWQRVMLDVTKTRVLEEQLRQSQKLESIGRLAGGIAHDFNNMLTAINGYSDLILRKLEPGDPLHWQVAEIQKAGKRSAELTYQLLAFSRQQVLKSVVLDVNPVIAESIRMFQRVIEDDIQLIAKLDPDAGRIEVDPGQFSQIIMNLVVNARDAMPEGGNLTIETGRVYLDKDYARKHGGLLPGEYVMLAISDTGMGMSAKTRKQIFDPFFTTKDVGLGTGLGLSTVHGIVKQSGGNIEVQSEKGVGTTFKIYLPLATGPLGTVEVKDTPAKLLNGSESILLVEDEEMVRHLTRRILEECGYKVTTAANGIEALKLCEEHCAFDLLMTDVVMPKMSGRELADNLEAKLTDLKVLFTSGYTDDAVVRRGIIETNSNFIQKPFAPEALARKIREILDGSGKS